MVELPIDCYICGAYLVEEVLLLFDVVFDDAVILMLGFVDEFETLGVAVVDRSDH